MKFKVVKNFQGEHSAPHACQIELVVPITGDEMMGSNVAYPIISSPVIDTTRSI